MSPEYFTLKHMGMFPSLIGLGWRNRIGGLSGDIDREQIFWKRMVESVRISRHGTKHEQNEEYHSVSLELFGENA